MFNVKYVVCGHIIQRYVYEYPVNSRLEKNPNFKGSDLEFTDLLSVDGFGSGSKMDSSEAHLFGLKSDTELRSELIQRVKSMSDNELCCTIDVDSLPLDKEDLEKKENNRIKSIRRARNTVLRVINCNPELKTFITLTFKDNVLDLDTANREFKKFAQRVNYALSVGAMHTLDNLNFKYVSVIEFQKRGAVHYHLLSNLCVDFEPRRGKRKTLSQKKFEVYFAQHIWKNGFVDVEPITVNPDINKDEVDNVGAYIVKYMTKDNDDIKLQGRKSYLMSKGLVRPTEVRTLSAYVSNFGVENDYIEETYGLSNYQPNYKNTYYGDYVGHVEFSEFNLKRLGIVK